MNGEQIETTPAYGLGYADGLWAARKASATLPDFCHHGRYDIYVDGQYVESAGNRGRNTEYALNFWKRCRRGKSVEASAVHFTVPNGERGRR